MTRRWLALLFASLLAACDGAGSPAVSIAPELRGVRVEGAVLTRPGERNAVEFSATLVNDGAFPQDVRVEGEWRTAEGLARGGFSASHVVPPGGRVPISSASASNAVESLALALMPAGPPVPEWARGLLTAASAGAVGAGVAFTPTPTLAEVPTWTPRGLANGVPFEARTVFFNREPRGWQLKLRDVAHDPLLPGGGMGPRVQTVHVDLPEEPVGGLRLEHGMRFGGAMFQILREPDATSTTSWNTEFALALEITEWSREPYDATTGGYQVGGRASGRVYVNFAEGTLDASFVAGEFDDVPIVYYGPPGE